MTPERFAKLRRALSLRQPDLTVLADSVDKSHNVSAIIRSADAVGVLGIHSLSTSGSMRRHHMIAGGVKSWVGLTLHASSEAALAALRSEGWRLLAAHAGPRARDFRDVDYTSKVALILGAELSGPSPEALEQADAHIAIPMQGLGESVNVSVAAAVILFEAQRQRLAAGLYGKSRLSPEQFDRTLFEWCYPEVAGLCRARGREYPPLAADGTFATNPFAREDARTPAPRSTRPARLP
jgi:tRNA (guanosine-2'-O-)-methyltransferase